METKPSILQPSQVYGSCHPPKLLLKEEMETTTAMMRAAGYTMMVRWQLVGGNSQTPGIRVLDHYLMDFFLVFWAFSGFFLK